LRAILDAEQGDLQGSSIVPAQHESPGLRDVEDCPSASWIVLDTGEVGAPQLEVEPVDAEKLGPVDVEPTISL
jgi:hypothetical protein